MNQIEDALRSLTNVAPSTPAQHRVAGAVVAIPTLAVLAIAAYLTPSSQGFGTHMQLGLGACTMLTLTGWPCPMCGMTTTFALLAEGRILEALSNQPFGIVLFSGTALAAVLGTVDVVTGRGALRASVRRMGPYEQIIAIGLLVGMMLGWMYTCVRMHPELLGA